MSAGNDEQNGVSLLQSFEWITNLPQFEEFIKSPKFRLLNVEVNYIIRKSLNGYYSIQICGENIKDLDFKFNFDFKYKGAKTCKMFFIDGRFHTSDNAITLLNFDERDLEAFPFYKKHRPLKYTLILRVSYEGKKCKEDKSVQTSSYMNANVPPGSLTDILQKLYSKCDQDGDVEIKCGKEVVKAHSLIVNSRSEVLKATLQNDGIIHIQDMDSTSFYQFMRYIYTEILPELNFEKAMLFYEIADMYAMECLMQRCGEFLAHNLTWLNACKCLSLAEAHSDNVLKRKVIDYVLENDIYLDDEVWLPFCEDYPAIAVEILNKSYKMPYKKRRYNP